SPAQWIALFNRVGRGESLQQYDLSSRKKLNDAIRNLYREMASLTPLRTTAEWLALCEEMDIPATAIYNLGELPDHPHLKAVGMFKTMVHPSQGCIRYVRPATLFSDTPADVRLAAPLLGQHSVEILGSLGYSETQI